MNRTRRLAVLTAPLLLLAACSSGDASPTPSDDPAVTTTGSADASSADTTAMTDMAGKDAAQGEDGHDHDHGAAGAGTSPTAEGFTIVPVTASFDSGYSGEFAFSIVTEGTTTAVTEFETHHEKPLHLILVNHELTAYLHLHPELGDDGVWRTPVAFPVDGFWRVVADFVSAGTPVLLGTDVVVGSQPMTMSNFTEEVRDAQNGPYTAVLSGDTAHEGSRPLKVTFTRDGAAVTTVNPYLGANAHMVAFSPALEYAHMHPNDGFVDGTMTFTAPALAHGFHKLFLQADFDGEIRLFEFVIEGK
ncbi:MAG: hypothetical protein KJS90_01395 [Acidobacteria bacterium]|nr:hypothetical protein [Acidobacteriota bacterium]